MSGLTKQEHEEVARAVAEEFNYGYPPDTPDIFDAVARIADEREARTREAIATGIERLICTPCNHEECCDDLRLAIEVAQKVGAS